MTSKNKLTENEWLNLIEEAINENVKIQVNYRFKYKDKNLGSFLTSTKRRNKVELMQKIEKLGFNFKMHSKEPNLYVEKFILQLFTDKKPKKQRYITRFNSYILPKKNLLKKQTIQKLNKVWKKKFGDIRKWEKPETEIDKIQKWKDFRYDKIVNPNGKWFDYKKNMGKLYSWVYVRKKNKHKIEAIIKYFNENEILELKNEGFLVEKERTHNTV